MAAVHIITINGKEEVSEMHDIYHSHERCTLRIPYPPVAVNCKDPDYARLLLDNYAGSNGELTAIIQYFYQYFIVKPSNHDFAMALECISITEMKHMEMLGELIVKLGGDPLLRTYNRMRSVYWTGNFISPEKDILKFLSENIIAEQNAVEAYKLRITQTRDTNIQDLLGRIILDENHHINIFREYHERFSR